MVLCSVCKKEQGIYHYKHKYYCAKCMRIAGHEDEYQKIRQNMKLWQLEDIAYLMQKKVEDNLLIKPKPKEYSGEWKQLFSFYKSRTEILKLYQDEEDKYNLIVYGGVHKTVFKFDDKLELAKFIRKLVESAGFKPIGKRKNGRAKYYI